MNKITKQVEKDLGEAFRVAIKMSFHTGKDWKLQIILLAQMLQKERLGK